MENLADKIAVQLNLIDQEVGLKAQNYEKLILMANTLYYKRGVLEQIARANDGINRELLKSMCWNAIAASISLSFLIAWAVIFFKILFFPYDVKLNLVATLGGACVYALLTYQLIPGVKSLKKIIRERKSFKIQEALALKKLNADKDFSEFKKQIVDYNESLIEIADQMKQIWHVIKNMVHADGADLLKVREVAERFPGIASAFINLSIDLDQVITRVNLESSIDFETIVFRGVTSAGNKKEKNVHILDVLECEKAILNLWNQRQSKS